MELTEADYRQIEDCFPKHRGSLTYSNLHVLNAILYVAENGCKWRRLPERFGNWHTLYYRMRRWAASGVLERAFEALQRRRIVRIKLESASLDSASVKVHPDGTGALKKTGRNPSEGAGEDPTPKFIWLPAMSERPSASPSRPASAAMDRKAGRF